MGKMFYSVLKSEVIHVCASVRIMYILYICDIHNEYNFGMRIKYELNHFPNTNCTDFWKII